MLITIFNSTKLMRFFSMTLISLSFVIPTRNAFAANTYLHDYANVISPQSTQTINEFLSEVEKRHALRIEAVILANFDEKRDKDKIVAVLENLNQAAPDKDQVILLVIVLNSDRILLYTSRELSVKFNKEVQKHLQQKIAQYKKVKNYDEMAKIAVVDLYKYYEETPPSSKKALFNIVFFILMLIILSTVIVKFRKQ